MALLFLRLMTKKVKDYGLNLTQSQILDQLKKIRLALLKMPKSEKIYAKLTRLNSCQTSLKKLFALKNYI